MATPEEQRPVTAEAENVGARNYKDLYVRHIESVLGKPENAELNTWYKERLTALPAIEISRQDSLFSDNVKPIYDSSHPEVLSHIENGRFFDVERIKITKSKDGNVVQEWDQLSTKFRSIDVEINHEGHKTVIATTGFVIGVFDDEGNMLVTLDHESTTNTPQNVTVKSAVQMSVGKYQELLAGKEQVDPTLVAVLPHITGGSIADFPRFVGSQDFQAIPLMTGDGNRQDTSMLGHMTTITQSDPKHGALTLDGKNRWITPQEARALESAQLLNNHTSTMLSLFRANISHKN